MSQLLTLASLALLVTSASGQTSSVVPATTDHGSSTTIAKIVKDTRLVYVPVVVEGKGGHAISGLTKEQFIIEQDGKRENIAFFEEVSQTVSFEKRAPAIAPGLVENFALSDAQARKTIIVILDTLNTPFLLQSTAKKALIKFLETSLPADQPVALMVLSGSGLHQVHSITADPKILTAIVKRVDSHYNPAEKMAGGVEQKQLLLNSESEQRAFASDMETRSRIFEQYMDDVQAGFAQTRAAETTIVALEQLAGCFAGIPGRKSVIWATGGFPFEPIDPRSFTGTDTSLISSYRRTWNRLNDANIALYPIDINGLEYFERSRPLDSSSAFRAATGGRNPNATAFDLREQRQSTLISFASATGGKAFLNSNDIAGSFAKASEESSRYYLLGYYLHAGDDKPGWHKLKVHADLKHVSVRAREGFFLAESAPKEKDRLKELQIALGSPADYTGVHFGIRLGSNNSSADSKDQSSANKRIEKVHVSFPPGALEVDTQNGNKVEAEFVILAMVGEKTHGQRLGAFELKLSPAELARANRIGLGFDETIEVPPGEYEVRAAIRDVNSGKVGTVRTHLVVP
jgi:VWFA-related protein